VLFDWPSVNLRGRMSLEPVPQGLVQKRRRQMALSNKYGDVLGLARQLGVKSGNW
jgi:hypothetical protein